LLDSTGAVVVSGDVSGSIGAWVVGMGAIVGFFVGVLNPGGKSGFCGLFVGAAMVGVLTGAFVWIGDVEDAMSVIGTGAELGIADDSDGKGCNVDTGTAVCGASLATTFTYLQQALLHSISP
jgi:hypothetical protein